MDTFPTLRCSPRRSILCFGILCVMFFACAFYTFFVDSTSATPPYKFVEIGEFQNEINSKPPDSVIVHNSGFQISTSDPMYSNNLRNTNSGNFSGKNNIPNISILNKKSHFNSAPMITNYIYRVKSSSTSVPTSTAVNNIITPAPLLDTCQLTMKDFKLILLWTSFFEYWDYLPKEHFRKCSRCRNCQVTRDRSKLLESDAVIFHVRDLSIGNLPSVRLPHQHWVFYCLESPPYSDYPGLQHTLNMFNWTMTYRTDSDIQSPYGTVSKIHPPRKLDLKHLEYIWSNKSKSVAWMSSHCSTHGGRDSYVMELQNYIDVDIYGWCGTSICPPGQTEQCYQEFAQKYKFFLAFENAICKDYITEKFFRTLKYNIVPVVFGGAEYDKFAPPGSFIDALSFKSPKDLAYFLAGVGNNFKLYSEFFQWRRDYSISLSNTKECQLCSMLHKKDLKPSSYENMREWWINDSQCRVWKPEQ